METPTGNPEEGISEQQGGLKPPPKTSLLLGAIFAVEARGSESYSTRRIGEMDGFEGKRMSTPLPVE